MLMLNSINVYTKGIKTLKTYLGRVVRDVERSIQSSDDLIRNLIYQSTIYKVKTYKPIQKK